MLNRIRKSLKRRMPSEQRWLDSRWLKLSLPKWSSNRSKSRQINKLLKSSMISFALASFGRKVIVSSLPKMQKVNVALTMINDGILT